MSKIPKVSVLIPIYNVEPYLDKCLNSVVRQSLKDIEIICINDGSTDGSSRILEKYAKADDRVVVIDKPNTGYGDSMNTGLKKATGKYVGIVESDDFIEEEAFDELYSLAEAHDVEVVRGNCWYYHEYLDERSPLWSEDHQAVYNPELKKVIRHHDVETRLIPAANAYKVIDPRQQRAIFYQKPAIWSAIYRRDFLEKNDISFLATPGASYQDTSFGFKVWASCRRALFTDKAYLHYRQDNETSSVKSPGKVHCISEEYKEIEDFISKIDLSDELGAVMQLAKFGAYMWNFKRLSVGLNEEFLKVFSSEYKEAEEAGKIDWSYFDINQQRNLLDIINRPSAFLKRRLAQNQAKVSVIVPVYNTGDYLKRCLDSLLNQTLRDIEIICVDDGSTDSSIDVLDEYYDKDPRINIYTRRNGGQSRARNDGLRQANAKFIMFCDSDDYYEDSACDKMYQAINTRDSDIAVCSINIVYTSPGLKAHYLQSDRGYYSLLHNGYVTVSDRVIEKTDVSPCNKIFRNALREKYDLWFPEGLWYEDAMFTFAYMLVCNKANFIRKEKLYNYIRREGSVMGTTSQKSARALDHTRVSIELFNFMDNNNLLKDHSELFTYNFKRFYKFSLKFTPQEDLPKLNKLVREFLITNKDTLDSVDGSIAEDLFSLLPKSKPTVKAPVRSQTRRGRSKKAIKLLAKKVLRRVSISYRTKTHVTKAINVLDKKMVMANRLTDKRIRDLNSQIAQLQTVISDSHK